MAGVDVGGGGRKRSANADVNMIPFIDLLLVTVAFLLITAVWTANKKLDANAMVPGERGENPQLIERTLHVHVHAEEFTIAWHEGGVVASERSVPRRAGEARYPELREAIKAEYESRAVHRDPDDMELDRLVLHTPDDLPYGEIVLVMDAVSATKREVRDGDKVAMVPAFAQTFAVH